MGTDNFGILKGSANALKWSSNALIYRIPTDQAPLSTMNFVTVTFLIQSTNIILIGKVGFENGILVD